MFGSNIISARNLSTSLDSERLMTKLKSRTSLGVAQLTRVNSCELLENFLIICSE